MTTNPHIKAGGLPPTELHRVEPSMLPNDAGEPRKYADRPMPYVDIEQIGKDGPEEMIAALIVLVVFIGALAIWRFA